MLFRGITKRFTCSRGNHDWERLEYERDRSCAAHWVCSRCGAKSGAETQHQYGEWEELTGPPCRRQRACRRCGDRQTETAHLSKYVTWKYVEEGSCDQHEFCTRCNTRLGREVRTVHPAWGEWEYDQEGVCCEQQRTCSRCQAQEKRTNHPWGEWVESGQCREGRSCSRCLTTEDREAHDYQLISEMYWGYDLFSRSEYRCSKCGDTRIEGILPPDYGE